MDKKITDLQLRSSVVDTLNLPSDDGIQSYRVTALQVKDYVLAAQAVQLSMLKNDVFTGLTAVTIAEDDYVPVVDTSDSNKTKKVLASTFRNRFRAITSLPDTLTVNDGTVKVSGASGTITLPTAVGASGRKYQIVHAGTSTTQAYTIATTSSQTVGGLASGAIIMSINGETLGIESDGANWLITNRAGVGKRIAFVYELKAAVTNGDTSSTSYTARKMNTLDDPTGLIVNSSSFTGVGGTNTGFTLNAGTYRYRFDAAQYNISGRIRLYNVTDSATVRVGGQMNSSNACEVKVAGQFTIAAQKQFQVQHIAGNSITAGYGNPFTNTGENECHFTGEIEKID